MRPTRPAMRPLLLALLCAGTVPPATALEALPDEALAEEVGRDGLRVTLDARAYMAGADTGIVYEVDRGTARRALLDLRGGAVPFLSAIGPAGQALGGAATGTLQLDLDAGVSPAAPAAPRLRLDLQAQWDRSRIEARYLRVYTSPAAVPARGFGALALDSEGALVLRQDMLLFTGDGSDGSAASRLRLTLGSPQFGVVSPADDYAQLYYRQVHAAGATELLLDRVFLDVGFAPGVGGRLNACTGVGACAPYSAEVPAMTGFGSASRARPGLYIGSPRLDFNADLTLALRTPAPTSRRFTTAVPGETLGFLYAGTRGSLSNAELLVAAGGAWNVTGPYAPVEPADAVSPFAGMPRSEGLNVKFHADYGSDFTLTLGEGSGKAALRLRDWVSLPGAAWDINFPNVTLDVLAQGTARGGGLCWGSSVWGTAADCTGAASRWASLPVASAPAPQFLDLSTRADGLALMVRAGQLQAYPGTVRVLNDLDGDGSFLAAGEARSFGWGLVGTLGQLDGNVLFYPGNDVATATADGLVVDALLMTQSFSRQANPLSGNSNFLIADTDSGLAFGLMRANALVATSDLKVALASGEVSLRSGDVRLALQGMVGGGPLPVMTEADYQRLFSLDLNLEFSAFDLGIRPRQRNGYHYIGFDGAFTLGDSARFHSPRGNYLALAEPSRPEADLRLAALSGSFTLSSGEIALLSAADTVAAPDGVPRLRFAAGGALGTSAGAGAGVLQGELQFGGRTLGAVVVPSGSFHASLALKPQGAAN